MLQSMPIRNLTTVTTPMHELHDRLHSLLQQAPTTGAPLAAQPLGEQVKVFERIERGQIDRQHAAAAVVQEVEQAVRHILTVLYTPLDGGPMIVPRDAWTRSPLMQLLASVTYWLYQDDLISPTEAARLLYGSGTDADLARIRRMIERGALAHYWRPGRQHKEGRAALVRRSDVERVQQHQQED